MKIKIVILIFLAFSILFFIRQKNEPELQAIDISQISFKKGTDRSEVEKILGNPLIKDGKRESYIPIKSGASISYSITYRNNKVICQTIDISACIPSISKKSIWDLTWQKRQEEHKHKVKLMRVQQMLSYINKKKVEP